MPAMLDRKLPHPCCKNLHHVKKNETHQQVPTQKQNNNLKTVYLT